MLPPTQPRPFRALYISAVIIVSLFVMAFLWFGLYAVIQQVGTAVASSMTKYDVANSTYTNFTLANTFITNVWLYFLVILMFGLLYWVWIYSQRYHAEMR